jgi:transcriptional regulator with XRE-family HTH domain
MRDEKSLMETLVSQDRMEITEPLLTPVQTRMARAALNWTRGKLAEQSGVAEGTIKRVEEGKVALMDTMWKLRKTFEREGLMFLDDRTVTARTTE